MKILILAIMLLPFTLFAYDSNEEIDSIKVEDNLAAMGMAHDKSCRFKFADLEPHSYDSMESISYKRKNCGDKLVDSLKDCQDVDYACDKPKLKDLDAALVVYKDDLKSKLAKRQAQEAKQAEKKALKAKQKDEDLSLAEINKILRD